MHLKKPIKFNEQLNKLIEYGMVVNDKEKSLKILQEINYYRFTGYTIQFRKGLSNNYIEGTSFETIYSIYKFDEKLRNIFRKNIEKIEIYYKTQIAYHFSISKCITGSHNQHYAENNFYNKKGYKEVMNSLYNEKRYYKDTSVFKHHKQKYSSEMPLWVIVELISFSNMSKLYNAMYYSEKDEIAKAVGTGRKILENHLHCLSVLRNKCSHAARLYNTNFSPPAKLPKKFLQKYCNIKNDSLFAYALILLKRLPNQESKKIFLLDINILIKKYEKYIDIELIGFTEDYLKIMNENM